MHNGQRSAARRPWCTLTAADVVHSNKFNAFAASCLLSPLGQSALPLTFAQELRLQHSDVPQTGQRLLRGADSRTVLSLGGGSAGEVPRDCAPSCCGAGEERRLPGAFIPEQEVWLRVHPVRPLLLHRLHRCVPCPVGEALKHCRKNSAPPRLLDAERAVCGSAARECQGLLQGLRGCCLCRVLQSGGGVPDQQHLLLQQLLQHLSSKGPDQRLRDEHRNR